MSCIQGLVHQFVHVHLLLFIFTIYLTVYLSTFTQVSWSATAVFLKVAPHLVPVLLLDHTEIFLWCFF